MTNKVILFTSVLLAVVLIFTRQAQAQSTDLVVLDRNKAAVTKLVDGDSIQLKIKLPSRATQPVHVTFAVDQGTIPIECTVQSNSDNCETERFASLGWYWDMSGQPRRERMIRALAGDATVATTRVQVSPRPVVLAHGFISSADAWVAYLDSNGFLASAGLEGFAVGDGQVEGKFNTGNIADPTGKTNTIAQNAEILARYISNVKKLTGAQQVDLVGHSMGGLISRYYIDRLMAERDVAQLIMLGTPQNGSDCANLPAAPQFVFARRAPKFDRAMSGIFSTLRLHDGAACSFTLWPARPSLNPSNHLARMSPLTLPFRSAAPRASAFRWRRCP